MYGPLNNNNNKNYIKKCVWGGDFPFLTNYKQLIVGGKWLKLSTSAASAHFGSDLLRQAIIPPFDVCLLKFELSFYHLYGCWNLN